MKTLEDDYNPGNCEKCQKVEVKHEGDKCPECLADEAEWVRENDSKSHAGPGGYYD